MINWESSNEAAELIEAIAKRACELHLNSQGDHLDYIVTQMNIAACHLNGNPLRLKELLEADEFNFSHDVIGIAKNMNPMDCSLNNYFVPRFSV